LIFSQFSRFTQYFLVTVRRWLETTTDSNIRFVLADDGCDVDADTIPFLPSKTTLIVLKADESLVDVCMQLCSITIINFCLMRAVEIGKPYIVHVNNMCFSVLLCLLPV